MPSLNNLPVELVVKILKGASLEDILNVTRTSTYFRSIGSESRSLWANAQDVEMLPLPMGDTLDTVSLSSMSKLAARAVALSTVWRGPIAHPQRTSHVGSQYRLKQPPLRTLTSLPGTILPGNKWLLVGMETGPHVYCPENGSFLPLVDEGSVVSYAYESSNNGASVVLAVLKVTWRGRPNDYDRFIDIYVLQFDPEQHFRALPSVTKARSIRIPAERYVMHIELKGPLVVVSGGNELLIANWQECSGVNLSLRSLHNDPEEEQSEDERFSMHAYFHPTLPLLLAEKLTRSSHSIHFIDCPAVLPPFESADLTDEGLAWHMKLLISDRIHIMESSQAPLYRGFRRSGAESPILDIIYNGSFRHLVHLSISVLEDLTPVISCHAIDPKGHSLAEVRSTAGRAMCLGTHPSHGPSYLRMPKGSGQVPTWVALELSEDVVLKGSKGEPLAFDDAYGTLLLDDVRGNYCIVQY